MLARETGAAENYTIASNEITIAFCVIYGVTVDTFLAGGSVMELCIVTVDEFTAVRLEAIYTDIQQILPFCKPALDGVRVGEVGHHGVREPVALRNSVGSAIGHGNTEFTYSGIFPVQIILGVLYFIIALLLVNRNLPEQKLQSGIVDILNHSCGIGPRSIGEIKILILQRMSIGNGLILCSVPDVERSLVAPCLQHNDRSGEIILFEFFKKLIYVFLGIPAVGGNPDAHGPFRRQNRRPKQAHVFSDHLLGGTGEQNHIRSFG